MTEDSPETPPFSAGIPTDAPCRMVVEDDRADILARRQAEETHARLAAIVEFSEDAILSKSLDGIINSWNAGAERIFGYKAEETIGRSVTMLMPPDRVDEEAGVLARIRRGESVEHYETVRQRKDGSLIDVSLTVSPIFDSQGRVTGASKIVRDITTLKRANRALSESEERLRLATEATEVGVWEWNLATGEVRWDARMFRIYGMEPTPGGIASYHMWAEAVVPDDRKKQENELFETIRRCGRGKREFRIRRLGDGECRYIQAVETVRLDSSGKAELVVGTNLDITDIRRREAALHASEKRFRSAVGIVSSLIWTNNAEGMMEGEQPGWASFTGQARELYQGYGWASAVHPDDAQPTLDAWRQAVAEKRLFEFEHRLRRNDGEWRLCSVRAVPVIDDQGTIHEWVGVHTDITDRRRRNLNVAFLASVSQDLLHIPHVGVLMETLGAKIGTHMELSRCIFAEADPAADGMRVIHDWQPGDLPGLPGGSVAPDFLDAARTGEPLAVQDTLTDARTQTHAALRIRACIHVPIVRGGACRFVLSVCRSEPHDWRENEIDLVREITSRLWARLERSHAEEALARAMTESEQQRRLYDTILSTTPDLIYVFDLDHRFSYANHALLEMWGLTLDQAVGKTCLEVGYEPWHAAMHDREIDHVVATKQPIRGEVPLTGPLGRRHYDYIFAPVLNDRGEVEAVAGATRDITRRKQVEAVEAGERKVFERVATGAPLSEILEVLVREIESQSTDGMRCSILLLDKSGRHLRMGAAPSLPEPYNQAIDGIAIGPDEGSCGTAAFSREPVFVENIAQDPRWADFGPLAVSHGLASCCSTPLLSLEGDVLGTSAMYYDRPHRPGAHDLQLIQRANKLAAIIIERKRSEEALTERTAALVRADRNKDEFLAMLAHELRNPLAPMRNAAAILKSGSVTSESRSQAQHIITRQIENMSRMIDDLLDVSRITQGKIELRQQRVELRAILAEAAEATRSLAAANEQEISVSLPAVPVFLDADATRLDQIFVNLLGNSCKYSGSRSHIALSARVSDANDQVIIRIADNGIGIEPELLPSIFDLFVQSSRTLDRSHGGLGIGLTIASRLVNLHGGTIEAHSDGPGCGAEFVIRLPLPTDVSDGSARPAANPTSGKSLRILIVDDNKDSAETMAMLQQLHGHVTRTAHTGPDAVTAASEFLPDVVLLDIGLPGMNGFEVARRIRAMGMQHVFLIALTGYGSEGDRDRARNAGFDEHLAKPADIELLRSWLQARFPQP